ncbi:phosphocarrier protein HPr [Staphylococcus aureus]|nr:phosphocarrier protein HPr [Staphylococcus aureus]
MEQNSYVIIDETGIHARPATMLVQNSFKIRF